MMCLDNRNIINLCPQPQLPNKPDSALSGWKAPHSAYLLSDLQRPSLSPGTGRGSSSPLWKAGTSDCISILAVSACSYAPLQIFMDGEKQRAAHGMHVLQASKLLPLPQAPPALLCSTNTTHGLSSWLPRTVSHP